MNFLRFKKNIFIKRIFQIKKSIFLYSLSSLIDVLILLLVSSIFDNLAKESSLLVRINYYFFSCIFLIGLRTFLVILLRKYSYKYIFYKKINDEAKIMKKFVENSKKNLFWEDDSLEIFKEKIINSCNLAAINFDIPIMSIAAEFIFALGGSLILIKMFGFKLILINLPTFIILIIFSKVISSKLNGLGKKIIKFTELRLNSIDNIGEIAIELAALNNTKEINKYFGSINKKYNSILATQLVTSNLLQIFTESMAFIIVLVTLISIVLEITTVSLANSATSLAIISRLVPSFTRSIAFITQLQFGVPSIERLSKVSGN